MDPTLTNEVFQTEIRSWADLCLPLLNKAINLKPDHRDVKMIDTIFEKCTTYFNIIDETNKAVFKRHVDKLEVIILNNVTLECQKYDKLNIYHLLANARRVMNQFQASIIILNEAEEFLLRKMGDCNQKFDKNDFKLKLEVIWMLKADNWFLLEQYDKAIDYYNRSLHSVSFPPLICPLTFFCETMRAKHFELHMHC
jgi:tetratricopeptide (TPR) repeat protein